MTLNTELSVSRENFFIIKIQILVKQFVNDKASVEVVALLFES